MASFDLNVEDSSPLFSYSPVGAWADSPDGDPLVSSYSGSSLHTTAAQGATATINFNGTGISLFGARRPNYGTFTISVDGAVIANGNAQSDSPVLNQLLGEATGLANGPHVAVLTNTGNGTSVDVDYMQLHDQIGSPGDSVTNSTIDDTDPGIQYSPSSEWMQGTDSSFMNSTIHYTSSPDASVTMSFSGNAVAIYGTSTSDHAGLNVQVDGINMSTNSGGFGSDTGFHPQTVLFYANNLGSQQHTLTMTPNGGGPFLDLDAITVYSASTSGPGGTNNQSGGQSPNSLGTHSGTKKIFGVSPVVFGGAIAGVVALIALLGILLFCILRRRRRTVRSRRGSSPLTPELPLQGPDTAEEGLASGFRSVPITPNRMSWKKSPRFFPGVRASKTLQRSTSPTSSIAPLVVPSMPPESRQRISGEVSRFMGNSFVVPGTPSPTSSYAPGRQRSVASRFTLSDYDTSPDTDAAPPVPPMPEEIHTRQARDHISRFSISDYAESDSNTTSPLQKRGHRPPTLMIPQR